MRSTLAAVCLSASSTFAQVTLSVDRLDGAEPGTPVPANLVVVDVFANVATTDAWTASGIRVVAFNGAVLVYNSATPAIINPGTGNRFVCCLSKPKTGRNDDARFAAALVASGGRYDPSGPTATTTAAELNATWFASPPETSTSPSVDGYIARVVIDVTAAAIDPTQIVVAATQPAGTIPLAVSQPSSGSAQTGTVAATFDVPTVSGLNWGIYAPACGSANVRYFVNANASGLNNGTSWTNAFSSLQSALAASCANTREIWVAAGMYKPTTGADRNATFSLKPLVSILGGFAGNETRADQRDVNANRTILSGDLLGNDGPTFTNITDNSQHVVTAAGVDNNAVLDGFTIQGGNAIGGAGGGLVVTDPTVGPMILNCTFRANRAELRGGAADVASSTAAPTTFVNCVFAGNQGANGAGLNTVNGAATAVNCLFTGNVSPGPGGGGGARCQNSTLRLLNCTFSGNSAPSASAVQLVSPGVTTMTNCVVWGNSGTQITGSPAVTYSDVQGGFAGTGNINADPRFLNSAGGDFRIGAGSPCIDAASTSALPAGVLLDLAGAPRFFNDPGTPNTGLPTGGAFVDIGAFEFHGEGLCDLDFNHDGNADQDDVVAFINSIAGGPCPQ